MKRFAIIVFTALFFLIAYVSKPDDRTCIIEGVQSVWSKYIPSAEKPLYYNQFMDLTSKSVLIDDWVFLKRIRYQFNDEVTKTIAIGAFNKVFIF